MSQTKAQLISDLVQALAFTATASAPTNGMFLSATNELAISTNSTQRLTVDSSGNVGIGTSSPSNLLHVNGQARFEDFLRGHSTQNKLYIADDIALSTTKKLYLDGGSNTYIHEVSADNIAVATGGSERLRIDSSGRLLVGASSSSGVGAKLQVIGDLGAQFHRGENSAGGASITLSKSRNTTYGSNTIVQDDDTVGIVAFRADDGTDYNSYAAFIGCNVDGTPGSNDMPGRLVFSTTADGASSPTERMRIGNDGKVYFGNFTSVGATAYIDKATSGSFELDIVASRSTTTNRDIRFFSRSNQESMRIDTSGNVGIGVSSLSSSSRLTLLESTGNAQTLEIKGANSGGAGSQPGVKFSAFNGDNIGGIFGDTNSDALRIQTGGTDRIYVTNAGNVGIGDNSPGHKLVVKDAGATNTSNYLNVISGNAANAGIAFGDTDTDLQAGILYLNSDNALRFFKSGFTEAARIDSSGNLGLGITSLPATGFNKVLRVKSATGAAGIFAEAPDTSSWLGLYGGTSTSDSAAFLYPDTGSLRIGTTSVVGTPGFSEKLRINSAGNVGIGTSSPSNLLHLNGTADQLRISDGSNGFDIRAGGSLIIEDDGTERLRIDSSGRVGIGTTSPGSLLHLSSSSPRLTFTDTDTNIGHRINCDSSVGNFILESDINNNSATSSFVVKVSQSEKLRIDNSGRLLVGTTSAGSNGTADDLIVANDGSASDQAGITIRGGTSGRSQIFFSDGTSGDAEYRGMLRYDHSEDSMQFRTAASERLRIDSSGNVSIGTNTAASNSELTVRAVSPHLALYATPGNDSRLNMGDTDDHDIGMIAYANSDNSMRFTANATERARIDSSGNLLLGSSSPSPNSTPRLLINTTADSQYNSISINGNFGSNFGKFFEASGKSFVRNTSERNIDLVQSINAGTNINVLVKFTLLLNGAVDDEAGEVTGTAGFHKTGGNPSFWTNVPSITHYKGSGMGSGSLQWVGGSATEKILRYTTDANRNYVRYVITSLVVTGHDYAPIKIL